MENINKVGGYDEHFVDPVEDKYKCPVCLLVLRKPFQTIECGHRFCESCSEKIKKSNVKNDFVCPLDRNTTMLTYDKAFEKEVLLLKVKCHNYEQSCQWNGELSLINKHLDSCEYQEVRCVNEQCSTLLLRKELFDHIETNCIYRLVTCEYCNLMIIYDNLQLHFENCTCFPLNCYNQCGIRILRKEMAFHIADGCALTTIPCQYLGIGCNFQGMRKEQDDHTSLSTNNHLSMAISKLTILENKILSNEKDIISKMDIFEGKVMSIKKEIYENMLVYENKFKKMASVENNIASIEKRLTEKMLILENKVEKMSILENKIASFENKLLEHKFLYENNIFASFANIENKINSNIKQMDKQETLKEQLLNILEEKKKRLLSNQLYSLSRSEITTKVNFLNELIKLIKLSMASSE